mgnify:CR=1 FL=1
MIPILYKSTEKDFRHNGIGPLIDVIKCDVDERRNGSFEVELQYPIAGSMCEEIKEDCIIKTKSNDSSALQLFRIYKSSKPINGIITYYGEHISYVLNGIPIESLTIKNAAAQTALSNILAAGLYEHDFTAQSDIDTLNSTNLELTSIRGAFGGTQGSILDVWGGEFEFDNFTVKLHRNRGKNKGIRINYGKNLTDIKQEKNISSTYTALFPYAKYTIIGEEGESDEEVTVTLTEKVIESPNGVNYAHAKVLMMDFTERFQEGEVITEAALRSKANSWALSSGYDMPNVNITVSFINLYESPEYSEYKILERVGLCDTVTVQFPALGVDVEAKVIRTVYDSINEQYKFIEIGSVKSSFADTVRQNTNNIEAVKHEIKTQATAANVRLIAAIEKATAAITGQSGGYVVLNPSNNPQEILIIDEPDIDTAVNVWRWNSAGLGYSSNGYSGPYALAITADGAIVADFITAGTLKGELLEADSVRANAISQGYKAEITNEITGAVNTIEQAFVAADEQLLSMIQTVTETLNDGQSQTEAQISSIIQTIEGLSLSFTNQYTGGINCVLNSSGLNGVSNDWEYTGSVQALEDSDTKNNTLAGSCFWINNGTLSQTVNTISGSAYTVTFRTKKGAVRAWVKIKAGGTEVEVINTINAQDWTENTLTFIAPSNTLTLEAYSQGSYLYIGDIMLAEGEHKQRWQPAPNEIYTTDVKIDRRGIHIINTESETSTIINNVEFAVLHKGSKVITVNKDTTILKKTEIQEEMTVGKLKIFPVADGVDEIVLD